MTLRAIDLAPFRARYNGPATEVGERPELQWVRIAKLRIDPRYQREIGRRGAENILAIAAEFKWAKFAPVVVAPIKGGLFAIVDGQHRSTAAALRGFESVPCVIIAADEADQADAFVAINANVTAMSPLQLHAARLAAGNGKAAELAAACAEAEVTICRYPVPANKIKPGETLAAGMLQKLLAKYGRDVLVAALVCITQTRRGNPGLIRAGIVEALCSVLEAEPDWCADRKKLIFRMQTFDFGAQFNAARAASIESGDKVSSHLIEAIGDHLERAAPTTPAAPPAQPSAARPAAAGKPASSPAKAGTGGLSIGRDDVALNGRSVKVGPRAALLVAALAKAKPNCVGDDFLISKVWTQRPDHAGELLNQLVRNLASLREIGLEVRTQRGIGRQLVDIDR
jgi:hypothetical protein